MYCAVSHEPMSSCKRTLVSIRWSHNQEIRSGSHLIGISISIILTLHPMNNEPYTNSRSGEINLKEYINISHRCIRTDDIIITKQPKQNRVHIKPSGMWGLCSKCNFPIHVTDWILEHFLKLLPGTCYSTTLMTRQHWFREWLDTTIWHSKATVS